MRLPLRQLRAIFSKGRGAVRRIGQTAKSTRKGFSKVRRAVLPTKKEHALSQLRYGMRVTKSQSGIATGRAIHHLDFPDYQPGRGSFHAQFRRAPLSPDIRENRQTMADILRAERTESGSKAFNKIVKLRGRVGAKKALNTNRLLAGGIAAYGAAVVGVGGGGTYYAHKRGVQHGRERRRSPSTAGILLGGYPYIAGYHKGRNLTKVRRSK